MNFLNHSIFYEVLTAAACPHRMLFDEAYLEDFSNSPQFMTSNIYFFCKVKKVRFNLDKTELINKRTLKTEIIIGNSQTKQISSSFFDLASLFRSIYVTRKEFEGMLSDSDDYWDCRFLKSESTSTSLVFNQVATREGKTFDFLIVPENYIFDLNIDLDNRPEVVYVGQSFRMLERIMEHKTLNKAISHLDDSHELRIYFLAFKYGYGGHVDYSDFDGQVSRTMLNPHQDSQEYKTKIDLIERFLIHFLKPQYNEKHVNAKIHEDKIVQELLIKNNVSFMSINFGMHGNGFQFWSPNSALKTDWCSFDFTRPDQGYMTKFGM
jgi:hypothetical protein